MSPKPRKFIAFLLVAALLYAGYVYYTIYGRKAGPEPVRTTGVVKAVETNISPKIPGRLEFVGFREGDAVKAGELVASIESADLAASAAQARTAVTAAEAQLRSGHDAVGKAKAEVTVAEAAVKSADAAVARAEAQLAQAGKDLKRAGELFARDIIARADLDLAATNSDTARAALDGAKSEVTVAKARAFSARASLKVAEGNIPTLKAGVAGAKDAVAVADAQLSYAKIFSPVDAVVEYRTLEPGEVVAPGQSILTLVDLSTLWVRIDLPQSKMDGVRAGRRATVTVDGMQGKSFTGEVFDVGREGEFATQRDVTRGQQDIKTFRTRIRVKDPDGILKPGMTVMVEIPVG
ncbi:MAG: efflux RND transporter periplasmic adaptor subunit [Nitrospirae bacterium]|nr:efflux RND transporter periplasmic adaptor subunit [Nitrospirota bacterium]